MDKWSGHDVCYSLNKLNQNTEMRLMLIIWCKDPANVLKIIRPMF